MIENECISNTVSLQSGAMTLERLMSLLYYMVPKLQITFNLGLQTKMHITSKKASNESCSKLNFIQDSLRAHMSISPRNGARASKD